MQYPQFTLLQDINPAENDQAMRFRRKIEKDDKWAYLQS